MKYNKKLVKFSKGYAPIDYNTHKEIDNKKAYKLLYNGKLMYDILNDDGISIIDNYGSWGLWSEARIEQYLREGKIKILNGIDRAALVERK